MKVSATISFTGTGDGSRTSRFTHRSTSSVVLPVPAPAVTTTLRSKVVTARKRSGPSAGGETVMGQAFFRLPFCLRVCANASAAGCRLARMAEGKWPFRQISDTSQ